MAYAVANDTDEDDIPVSEDETVHAEALAEFDAICSAQQEERAAMLQDRRFFAIAGAQWEGDWWDQFQNSIMVEVNKTALGVKKIIADYSANRMIVNYRAVDKGASEETAELLDGMLRADVYNSKGQQAADNAFGEAVQGGMGAWRLSHRYEDDADPDNEHQRIFFDMIGDADQSVFFDMDARLYDKSDARYCFVITAMSPKSFRRQYGEDKRCDWPEEILKAYYDWYTPDVVRVAEYYCVEEKKEDRLTFEHRATGEVRKEWLSDIEDLADLDIQGWRLMRRRRVTRKRVAKYVMSGNEILRPKVYVAGDIIPIIPVYGERNFIDNMERVRGHVRLAKDPQRIYNSQISKLVETAAIAPTERPILTPAQVAGHENSWAEANITRAPYALVNPLIGADGAELPAGPIGMITPPQLSPVLAALIQQTAGDIAELTAADDGADEAKSNISAEAMDIAATRTDAKSFTYTDNMRQSWQRCGEVYQAMARAIYVEEGREVDTMAEDGARGTATLAEPVTDDKGAFTIRNDLSKGKYDVIADVTEATTTRRDKTVKTLVNVAQIAGVTNPELANAALNTAVLNMDGEGMNDLQDWLRGQMLRSGLVKPTEEEARQLEEESANQQPDPQSQALQAVAAKEGALAEKAVADTDLSRAKTKLTEAQTIGELADAHRTGAETVHIGAETRHLGVQTGASAITAHKDAHTPVEPPKSWMTKAKEKFGGKPKPR